MRTGKAPAKLVTLALPEVAIDPIQEQAPPP